METIEKLFAQNMREKRKSLKMTQGDLAEKADLSTNYIGLLERCRKSPSFETMEKIAKALGIDTFELFSGKDFPAEMLLLSQKEILKEIEKAVLDVIKEKIDELEESGKLT
jgi:transcriptional regulator with XRE-family HTH domain